MLSLKDKLPVVANKIPVASSREEATGTQNPIKPQINQYPYVDGQTTVNFQPVLLQPFIFQCLMDLPGDCLLEIIDRLPFLDRLRFRVNKRLHALEPHATAIANEIDRFEINTIHVVVRN